MVCQPDVAVSFPMEVTARWGKTENNAKRKKMKTKSLIVRLSVASLNESLSCLHPSVLMYAVYTSYVNVRR